MGRVKAERARQIALGYTPEHDQKAGLAHLFYWSFAYFSQQKFVESAALIVAAVDLVRARLKRS